LPVGTAASARSDTRLQQALIISASLLLVLLALALTVVAIQQRALSCRSFWFASATCS
jgi:hypothetical protein